MTSYEIRMYIDARNGELSSDEILKVIDVSRNKQINHIVYRDNHYQMWDDVGNYFEFKKREWS